METTNVFESIENSGKLSSVVRTHWSTTRGDERRRFASEKGDDKGLIKSHAVCIQGLAVGALAVVLLTTMFGIIYLRRRYIALTDGLITNSACLLRILLLFSVSHDRLPSVPSARQLIYDVHPVTRLNSGDFHPRELLNTFHLLTYLLPHSLSSLSSSVFPFIHFRFPCRYCSTISYKSSYR